MTGLLQRLVERAAGTASIVRSSARLSAAAIPRTVPEPLAVDDRASADTAFPPAPAYIPDPDPIPRPAVSARAESRFGPAAMTSGSTPTPPIRATIGAGGPPEAEQPLAGPRLSTALDAGPATMATVNRALAEARPAEPHVAATRPPIRATRSADDWLPPARLLDRVIDPLPKRPLAPVPASPVAAAAADLEPTEIHIHIGQIDLNATVETPPARRKREAPRSVSLDAYLATRGGRE